MSSKKLVRRIVSVLSAIAATLCCVFRFPTYSSGEEQPDFQAMAEEMVVLVNEARVEAGLKPLYMVPYLCDVSNVRARECIFSFSHLRPDESLFITALDASLVPYATAAENIAAGMNTAEGTFNQWKNSEYHWNAIMNPDYTHIGIGICYEQNSTYRWYWEQLFVQTGTELPGQELPQRYKVIPKSAGDINGDGVINSLDIISLNKYLAGELYLNDLQRESADVLADGAITSADVTVLKKYVLGEYRTLPMTMDMILGMM